MSHSSFCTLSFLPFYFSALSFLWRKLCHGELSRYKNIHFTIRTWYYDNAWYKCPNIYILTIHSLINSEKSLSLPLFFIILSTFLVISFSCPWTGLSRSKKEKRFKKWIFPPFYDKYCFSNCWNPYALIETKLVSLCTLKPFLYSPLIFLSRHKRKKIASISTKRKTPEIPNEIENVDSALLLTFLSVYWSLFVESLLFSYKPHTFIIPVPCWKSVIFHFRIYLYIIMLYWFRN